MPAPTIIQSRSARILKTSAFDPSTQVLELPIERNQDPATLSWNYSRRFVGIPAQIEALAAAIGGIKSIIPYNGSAAYSELRAVFQGSNPTGTPNPDAEIVTIWRLRPARITKPLWQIPLIRDTMLRVLTDAPTRNRFRTDFEALVRGDVTSPNPLPDGTGANWKITFSTLMKGYKIPTADQKSFEGLLGSFGLGTDSFPVASVMLSRVDVAPSNASVGAAGADFEDFSGLLTTRALLGRETDMIPLIRSKIQNNARLMAGYWFKEMPSFEQEDANKVRVETNYTFSDDYDPFIWGKPITR